MNHRISTILIFLCFLGACGKKEDQSKTTEEKHDDNIVSLTTENLQHIEIRTEPVALRSIEKTLKAAGRVIHNQNKTAKISSTLEGRLSKVNFDLNDSVKAGDVLGWCKRRSC